MGCMDPQGYHLPHFDIFVETLCILRKLLLSFVLVICYTEITDARIRSFHLGLGIIATIFLGCKSSFKVFNMYLATSARSILELEPAPSTHQDPSTAVKSQSANIGVPFLRSVVNGLPSWT